jgi:hypothetical protein
MLKNEASTEIGFQIYMHFLSLFVLFMSASILFSIHKEPERVVRQTYFAQT